MKNPGGGALIAGGVGGDIGGGGGGTVGGSGMERRQIPAGLHR